MIDGIVDLDRKWLYVEPDEAFRPVSCIRTEAQILREYWPFWSGRMRELGRQHLISPRNCIEDWIIMHWARRWYPSHDGH